PTMAKTSPAWTSNETSLTACTTPPSVANSTVRPSTDKSDVNAIRGLRPRTPSVPGSLALATSRPEPGVQRVTQSVPDEHEGGDHQEDGAPGEEQHVRRAEEERLALRDHQPPRRLGLGDANPQERQR